VSPLLRVCGCGALTPTTPCPACKAAKGRRHRQLPTWQTYNTARWRALRKRILERDDHTCQRCGGVANTAGHIIPFVDKDDPNAWDEDNIQAECGSCNAREQALRRAEKNRRG